MERRRERVCWILISETCENEGHNRHLCGRLSVIYLFIFFKEQKNWLIVFCGVQVQVILSITNSKQPVMILGKKILTPSKEA